MVICEFFDFTQNKLLTEKNSEYDLDELTPLLNGTKAKREGKG